MFSICLVYPYHKPRQHYHHQPQNIPIINNVANLTGLTLGNYLTPTLLGGKSSQWFTEQIYTQFITRFNWEQGAAFGFLLLGLSTAIVWVGLKISGQKFGEVMRAS